MREVCLEGNNGWASAAADWLEHRHGGEEARRGLQTSRSWSRTMSPRVRPWHRGQAQQGRRDHHPGSSNERAAGLRGDQRDRGRAVGHGIAKRHRNERDDYRYRSIDDVVIRLSPLLAKHKLCVLPRVLERTSAERAGDGDLLLVSVTLRIAFDLVSSADGSSHTIEAFGEALDACDKATAKAMSSAYKYALLQAFCVPVAQRGCRCLIAPPEAQPVASARAGRGLGDVDQRDHRHHRELCDTRGSRAAAGAATAAAEGRKPREAGPLCAAWRSVREAHCGR